mmetsp:Transcript_8471/g.21808  ORF Transcript_8471/g.21808 Transcript_8471/m.21808 type:complete len:301 (-) Transcript_8471:676-1578(-)
MDRITPKANSSVSAAKPSTPRKRKPSGGKRTTSHHLASSSDRGSLCFIAECRKHLSMRTRATRNNDIDMAISTCHVPRGVQTRSCSSKSAKLHNASRPPISASERPMPVNKKQKRCTSQTAMPISIRKMPGASAHSCASSRFASLPMATATVANPYKSVPPSTRGRAQCGLRKAPNMPTEKSTKPRTILLAYARWWCQSKCISLLKIVASGEQTSFANSVPALVQGSSVNHSTAPKLLGLTTGDIAFHLSAPPGSRPQAPGPGQILSHDVPSRLPSTTKALRCCTAPFGTTRANMFVGNG